MTENTLVIRGPTRWKGAAMGAAFVAVAVVVLASRRGGTQPKPVVDSVPVLVRQVNTLNRADLVVVSGDVQASRSGNIAFQVPGVVVRVWPEEGQVVQAGAPLAQLDTTEYQLQLVMASATMRQAEDQYHRLQQMYQQQGIPPADFVKVETSYQQAQAQLALMRKHLADTRLVAPIGGAVARRGVEVGEQVAPGIPVFTLIATDPAEVRAGVPESEIGRIRIGQAAEIRIPALANERFEGRVKTIGVAADPVSRTYAVKITVPNTAQRLRPGMIAEASIQQDNRIKALTIPANAIVRDADGATQVFVYQANEHRVHARRIDVGSVYGKEVEVTSGLTASDVVVVGGQYRIREGSVVEATNATEPAVTEAGRKTP
ncbi:MAG: efflux RND transporter periplasmic adaptor subunit [Gemmatimonadaceae bacterium]